MLCGLPMIRGSSVRHRSPDHTAETCTLIPVFDGRTCQKIRFYYAAANLMKSRGPIVEKDIALGNKEHTTD